MIPVRGPTQLESPLISPNLKQKPTSINKSQKISEISLLTREKRRRFPVASPWRGYSWEILVGVCRPDHQILTLLQTKKCFFTPVLRPGL